MRGAHCHGRVPLKGHEDTQRIEERLLEEVGGEGAHRHGRFPKPRRLTNLIVTKEGRVMYEKGATWIRREAHRHGRIPPKGQENIQKTQEDLLRRDR